MLDFSVGLSDEILKFTMPNSGGDGALGADEGGEGKSGTADDGEKGHGFEQIGDLLALLRDPADVNAQELNFMIEAGGVKTGEIGRLEVLKGVRVEPAFEGLGVAGWGAAVGRGLGHGRGGDPTPRARARTGRVGGEG